MFRLTKDLLELSETDPDLAVNTAIEQIHKDWDETYAAADIDGKAELLRLENKYQKLYEFDPKAFMTLLMIREAKFLLEEPEQ